jgi:hypothetical protein
VTRVDLDAIVSNGWAPPDTVLALVAELRAAREVVEAVPSVEHLEALIRWLDLLDLFASKVDPTYSDLPHDEMQQDLSRLIAAIKEARS